MRELNTQPQYDEELFSVRLVQSLGWIAEFWLAFVAFGQQISGAPADPTVNSSLPTPESSGAVDHDRWFAEEVQPHDSHLKAYLRGAFPSVRDVDDVVQESYLRLWRTRATQPIRCAKAFVFSVARRLALDAIRRERTSLMDPIGDLSQLRVLQDRPDAAELAGMQEKIRLLADAVESLPARCRDVVVLRKIKSIPQKEVAAILGLSEKTVESQFTRGLQRCASYLRDRGVYGLFSDESR
jgi:RNA polymerase sigma factor (sigma-70 family)